MDVNFNFCPECGSRLSDSERSKDGWSSSKFCSRCGFKVTTVYGDAMGGSSDSYSFEKPACVECYKSARHAYSDATTPGFFHDKCEKHRGPVAPPPASMPPNYFPNPAFDAFKKE